MRTILLACLLAFSALLHDAAAASPKKFSFAVVAPHFQALQEDALSAALSEAAEQKPAFMVVNGIKSDEEPCSDALYERRKSVLEDASQSVILSLAAADWTGCKRENTRSAASERLNRLRELFFFDSHSLGADKLRLARQSAIPKFRSYGENARWEKGGILFATINLPADNNHFLPDAGRNAEFEDRSIANAHWLRRIFLSATQKKAKAVVLFCDGDPFSVPGGGKQKIRRDGFKEVRQQLLAHASRFPGKVLIIHSQGTASLASSSVNTIAWRSNLGLLGVESGWLKISVDSASSALFSITEK